MVEPRRIPARRRRPRVPAELVLAGAALVGVLACQALASSSSTAAAAAAPSEAPRAEVPGASGGTVASDEPSARIPGEAGTLVPDRSPAPAAGGRVRLGAADGVVPNGTTVFDDDLPGIANLDADLLAALRDAARVAGKDGIEFVVESGWRSRAYQERLLRQAIKTYGSAAKAARWVATADTSPHVSGDAVDIGSSRATAWLSEHGARYGLCQAYRNEPWHYELRPAATDRGCPAMYADPSRDPRMQP